MRKTAAAVMAVRQFEAKRSRHAPGFYKALHERSTADLLENAISKDRRKHSRSALSIGNAGLVARRLLPPGQGSQQEKKAGKTFEKPAICVILIYKGSKAAMNSLQMTQPHPANI